MKTRPHVPLSSLLLMALAAAGCGGDLTLPAAAPEVARAADGGAGVMFNPQPESPARILPFRVSGDLSRMTGRILGEPGGEVHVTGLELREQGNTLHVVQRWEIHPPDPVTPIVVEVAGIINLITGMVVLNGQTDDGTRAHVRGTAEFSGSGGISIGGELMFNPQPEPPAL